MKSLFELSWGDPACVREEFLKWCSVNYNINQSSGRYRCGEQSKNLEDKTRILSEELLGINHKYIVITNGAMQGLDAGLSFFKNIPYEAYPGCSDCCILKCDYAMTRHFYFPYYSKIIKKNGLSHLTFPSAGGMAHGDCVEVNDSPSNPQGLMGDVSDLPEKVIWDAVYNNPIYKGFITPPIHHNLAIGSFGKLFGLPGLRIGWVGTNDKRIYEYISNHVETTTCGVSAPSQIMIEEILEKQSWMPLFFKQARAAIDSNKTEMLKIKHIFDGQVPEPDGMFFFTQVDSKALKILSKAGIKFTPGDICGDNSGAYIRLNMAQTNAITSSAIKSILKADKI